MAIVLTIAFLLTYTYGLFRWDKYVAWRLSIKVSKTIKYVHYLTLFVAMTIAFTYSQFDVGLRGLWTTRTFVIVALLTGVFFNFVTDKTILNKIEKIYFRLFSFLPPITGVILCIPFLGVVIVVSLLGRLIEPASSIYYEDEHLRIQSSFTGVLAPKRIDIFAKKSFYEKYLYEPDLYCEDSDSIAVNYDKDSTRIFVYQLPQEDNAPKVICIDRQK
ncbi:hypothetical protein BH10BAC1_BH10BAC1_16890 [soil metagenome]